MGQLHYFLGIEVQYAAQGMFLSQKKYITELLQKTAMTDSTPTPTPMVGTPKLTAIGGSAFGDVHLYRSILGTLQYVCITRPDIAFCENKLSQFMNSPQDTYWRVVKRVLRYLQGILQHGLFFM